MLGSCRGWAPADGPIGSLALYSAQARDWDDSEVSALQAYAGVVANLLGSAAAAHLKGPASHQRGCPSPEPAMDQLRIPPSGGLKPLGVTEVVVPELALSHRWQGSWGNGLCTG